MNLDLFFEPNAGSGNGTLFLRVGDMKSFHGPMYQKRTDLYVKAYLLPDKKKQTKKKTQGKKETCNPEYNETISYFLAEIDHGKARILQVSVIDHASVGGSDIIGSFSVNVNEVVEGQTLDAWFPLIRDKDRGGEPMSPM